MPSNDQRSSADGGPPSPRREVVFIGGTGRSGTHIVAELLGHHPKLHDVPIECRFHCNPKGLADLVEGRTTPEAFLTKLRGYWWHRVRFGRRASARLARLGARGGNRLPGVDEKVRGLHKIMPRERLDDAISRFEASLPDDAEGACRDLFYDLLWPEAEEAGKPVLVEMSCFTIASAPGLARILPEARFVHSVRDGRDSGSSKVSLRQKEHHPTDVGSGIEWWEGRLRQAEEGVRRLPDADRRLHVVGLDELVWGDRDRTYARLLEFLDADDTPEMRTFFDARMSADAAHRERWREGLDPAEQAELQARYERALERIEAEGYHCAPVLRRSYERTLGAPR